MNAMNDIKKGRKKWTG